MTRERKSSAQMQLSELQQRVMQLTEENDKLKKEIDAECKDQQGADDSDVARPI